MTEQQNATYEEQVKADFKEFFQENYSERYKLTKTEQQKLDLEEEAYQAALDSSVTGNDNGSYYMNRDKAREMVMNNIDYVAQVLYCLDVTDKPLEYYIFTYEFETLDVIVRYHTLEIMFENGELI